MSLVGWLVLIGVGASAWKRSIGWLSLVSLAGFIWGIWRNDFLLTVVSPLVLLCSGIWYAARGNEGGGNGGNYTA